MLARSFAVGLSLTLLVSARASMFGPENQGAPCPGCVDTTAAPNYSNSCDPGDAGAIAIISNHSGACWVVSNSCVMSYPCTPWMRVSVWTNFFCGGVIYRAGYVGSSGVGGGRIVAKNYGPIDPDIVYEDITGVDCGGSTHFSVGGEIYSKNCWTPGSSFEGAVTADGTFTCTACSN